MSAEDFKNLRARCIEAWALAELGRTQLERQKNRQAWFGKTLGLATVVLGAINTAEASGLIADLFSADTDETNTQDIVVVVLGVLTMVVGGVITVFDPGQRSAKAREGWVGLGGKQRELETLVYEASLRSYRGEDDQTATNLRHDVSDILDQSDVPSENRHGLAESYERYCPFKDTIWRGSYIGDDSPTSEEADASIQPIGGS